MKFIVKDCDPITWEVQDDGYQEDYRVTLNLLLTTYKIHTVNKILL